MPAVRGMGSGPHSADAAKSEKAGEMVSEVDRRVNLKEPWMVSLTESEEKRSSGGKAPAAGPLEQDTRQVTNPFDGPDHLPRKEI